MLYLRRPFGSCFRGRTRAHRPEVLHEFRRAGVETERRKIIWMLSQKKRGYVVPYPFGAVSLFSCYALAVAAIVFGVSEGFVVSDCFDCVWFCLRSLLRTSIPPFSTAPSSTLMRMVETSPVTDPSLRISTRSLHSIFPLTFPMTTTSRAIMFAWTTPLRPTVTRLSGRLILPSMRPSMYSDSEPLSSPLMTSVRPMVACSTGALTVLTGLKELGFAVGGVDFPL